jgi:hypothetical protein
MEKSKKVQELRQMMLVARMLRRGASGAKDRALADLYLRTAAALEDRASRLAFGRPDSVVSSDTDFAMHMPVNLTC